MESCCQGVTNRWNRWSENQSINRWQSMPINRLISIIDEQSMLGFYVIIDFIDYQFLSIINANRSVNCHRLVFIFYAFYFQSRFPKTRSLCILMMKTAIKLWFFSQRWLIHRGEHGYTILWQYQFSIRHQIDELWWNCDQRRLMVVALKLNTIQCNAGVILKTLKIILKD